MNYVEPIRDSNKVYEIANKLRKYSEGNYIMFILGSFLGVL
ncbi:hypothetical protein [Clostridium perfringens]|nr:hypothetical protein [Clostridium perfringens]